MLVPVAGRPDPSPRQGNQSWLSWFVRCSHSKMEFARVTSDHVGPEPSGRVPTAEHDSPMLPSASGRPPPATGLDAPANVAAFFAWLLFECPADDYGAKDWDIQDSAHHAQWASSSSS